MKEKRNRIVLLHLLTTICLSIILIPTLASASPVIDDIILSPSDDLWIGENLTISVNCTDNINYTITTVNAQIVGKDGYIIPNKTFDDKGGGLYEVVIEDLYMNKPNSFLADISCMNNESVKTIQQTSFTVSNFSVSIVSDTPIFVYTDDNIEIDVNVKKNDTSLSSDVEFEIKIDDEKIEPKIDPPYDPGRGWILYLDTPDESGTFDLDVLVSYGRANETMSTGLTVEDPIVFSINKVHKTLVESGEEINIDVEALKRGHIISLNEDNLEIKIASHEASIKSITPISNYFRIKIEVPSLSPSQYTLTASLKKGNYTYSDSEIIDYAVPISGEFVTDGGRSIPTEIRFSSDGMQKFKLNTKTDGSYESNIEVGIYDILFTFPESRLELRDVHISSFDDPLNYYYSISEDLTPGLKSAGLFAYETTLFYSKVRIEMEYNEKDVYDETVIKLYRCSNWNIGKKKCYGSWEDVGGVIDTVRNIVTFEGDSLSAYSIGTVKELSVDSNINKEKYYLEDLIRLRGVTFDKYKNTVGNVSVRAYIKNTDIDTTVSSDRNGIFTIEFLSPKKEGKYTLYLSAKKYPYIEFNSDIKIDVVESRDISINFADTIKIKQSENVSQEITLENVGQADLYGLNISITGIPEGYYTLMNFIEKIKSGGQEKIWVSFSIPVNAGKGTSSATLKVFNNDISEEKIFGFTIVGQNETTPSSSSQPSTGFFTLPEINTIYTYILVIIFAAASFTLAIVLKRRKKEHIEKKEVRTEIESDILELKNHISQNNNNNTQNKIPEEYYKEGNFEEYIGIGEEGDDSDLTWDQLKDKWLNGGNSDFGG